MTRLRRLVDRTRTSLARGGRARWSAPALADLTVVVGALVWLAIAAVAPLGSVERLLALAPLVLVPLGLRLAATPTRTRRHAFPYWLAVLATPVAAPAAVASLALAPGLVAGVLSLPWLGTTALVALFGGWRLLQRGLRPVEELAVDAGLAYLLVGGIGLTASRFGLHRGFEPIVVLLTGVHFHYAGFVLLVFAGLTGRTLADRGGRWWRAYSSLAAAIVVGPGLVGLGIAFSPAVEVVAVALFTAAVALLGLIVVAAVAPVRPRARGSLLALAAVGLPASMLLALAYGVAVYTGRDLGVDLSTMVTLHGHLNALVFALLGLVGWRLAPPDPRTVPPGMPTSRLAARVHVGADFFDRRGLRDSDRSPRGMVDDFAVFAREEFDPGAVHPDVRAFYEDSGDYDLRVDPDWPRWTGPLARVYVPLARRIGQLNLPLEPAEDLTSEAFAVDSAADGRADVRAWTRSYGDGTTMYAAAYATHEHLGRTYLTAAFPLPQCNLSGVLRPGHLDGDGLLLTTDPDGGDAGLYLCVRGFAVRLPLSETLELRSADGGDVTVYARHEVTLLGARVFTLDYELLRS